MSVETKDELIIIKGEDKTKAIIEYRYNETKDIYYIKYKSGKTYPYRSIDVQIFTNPKNIDVSDKIVSCNASIKVGAITVQTFSKYCRIIYSSGYTELFKRKEIKIIDSALKEDRANKCFNYLKEIASKMGLIVNGHNTLLTHYNKIDFVREDSVFASFLAGEYKVNDSMPVGKTIFPFGFNLSQRQAVQNALNSDISIIEGPPGTGKTQTILNIIANAVMRGESVAVVSNNNAAIDNVYEKLKKYEIDFIAAPLGCCDNKNTFITNQSAHLPDMDSWNEKSDYTKLNEQVIEIVENLKLKNELSILLTEEDALKKEQVHFNDYYKTLDIDFSKPKFRKHIKAKNVLKFASEYEFLMSEQNKIGFFKKIVFRLKYGIKITKFVGHSIEKVIAYCQNIFYEKRLLEILERRRTIESILNKFDFDKKMQEYSDLSMKEFKSVLYHRYSGHKRKIYTIDDLWKRSEDFISDYPVILSTTYSLRSSLSSRTYYDYVIVDEASQVDLATGAIALSCAKKAVIVGDLKQLPNVVTAENKAVTDSIFLKYDLPLAYRYSDHSLLSSIRELFPEAPHVLLKEHYRCHPEIIGFCNQRFYNNELIILTKPKSDRQAMMVYKTVAGNMARGHINERQIDVIVNEVFPQQNLSKSDGSVGIVTPYRDQANRLQEVFNGTNVKADTADKFQGQERSVMIFSTVDNEIGEFVSNPNRLNVAVSRAVDQFIVVTDGNENDKTSAIHELIGYIKYNNHDIISSKINSVFDYLYEANAKVREEILQKYGRVSEFDSENLMYILIKDILKKEEFSKYNVVMKVSLRSLLCDLTKLNERELEFAKNNLTHVDFLIYSRLTHQPILVIEVDGFSYHNTDKQRERDGIKNAILKKYEIPILRLSTVGSGERDKIIQELYKTI